MIIYDPVVSKDYINVLNTEKSSLIDFKRLVQDKIELEKYIVVTSGQQKLFFAEMAEFYTLLLIV